MKAGVLPFFASSLGVVVAIGIPSFARSSSLSSRTALPTPASIRPSDYLPAMATNAANPTETSDGSWSQSAGQAIRNAELATEKAYHRAARDVQNLTLKGRIEAVLHENKSARGSDVHVTTDNGTVTLSGQVPSERTAQNVEQVVANVYGVKAINNQLSYPRNREAVTPRDSHSTGVAHPAYSDLAPAERAPAH